MLQDLGDAADSVGSDTDFAVRLLESAQRIAPAVSAQQERALKRASSGSHGRSFDTLTSSIERLVKDWRLGSVMVPPPLRPVASESLAVAKLVGTSANLSWLSHHPSI